MVAPIDARTRGAADCPCLRRDPHSDLQGPREPGLLRHDPATAGGHGNFPRCLTSGVRRRRMDGAGGGERSDRGHPSQQRKRRRLFLEDREPRRRPDVGSAGQDERAKPRYPSPAHLDRQGKLPLLTYADRRMVSVSMVVTRDPDFRTWDVEHRLRCYQYCPDGKPIADASYPVSVAVGDHRRFVVDYEIRPEGKWISGYFVDLPLDWQ